MDDSVVDLYGQILAYGDTASVEATAEHFGLTRAQLADIRMLELDSPSVAKAHEEYRAHADAKIEQLIDRALMLGLRKLERSFSQNGQGAVDMRLPASLEAVSNAVTKLRDLQVSRQILQNKPEKKPKP